MKFKYSVIGVFYLTRIHLYRLASKASIIMKMPPMIYLKGLSSVVESKSNNTPNTTKNKPKIKNKAKTIFLQTRYI